MKYVFSYLALSLIALLMQILPFFMIGWISSTLAFLVHRIVRYRRRTALQNLRNSFPEKTEGELKRMLPKIYRNMTDVFLEVMFAVLASRKRILKLFTIPERSEFKDVLEAYRGGVIMAGHIANWEICGFCFHEVFQTPGIVAYHPLKNPWVDKLMYGFRAKSFMHLTPMKEIARTVMRKLKDPHYVLLIADQSPNPAVSQWEEFFHQETAFVKGPATISHKFDLPVYFAWCRRIRRHHYELQIQLITADPKEMTAEEITRKYVRHLEAAIRQTPTDWLWTHKRWKHQKNS